MLTSIFFSNRTCDMWNALLNTVVEAFSLNTLTDCLIELTYVSLQCSIFFCFICIKCSARVAGFSLTCGTLLFVSSV